MDLLVLAKEPLPGRVKTRLCPPCTPAQAATVAAAALADTLAAARASGADRVVLALDGRPGDWCPPGVEIVDQGGGNLAARLTRAWTATRGPAVQIGMDTPQLGAGDLDHALAALVTPGVDAVLGPAADGGWWALGLRKPHPRTFTGIPTSRPDTGARQADRLAALGLRTRHLPVQRDVDTWPDARAVAAACPNSTFAAAVRRIRFCVRDISSERDIPYTERRDDRAALVSTCGDVVELAVDRWRAPPDEVERGLLASLPDPVLDVGCGPGRIVAALAAEGRMALGVDPSPAAVDEAHRRRAPVLRRSVFGFLPGERRWGTVLLLDGNVGIGGDPIALLRRAAQLLRPGGHVVAEVERPGTGTRALTVRVVHAGAADAAGAGAAGAGAAGDVVGPWFPWARVGADDFADLAGAAGLVPAGLVAGDGRWFARARAGKP